MAEEVYISPHEDIAAAYNALLALENVDAAMYGKRMKARIERNAIIVIDKALQDIAAQYEESEDED